MARLSASVLIVILPDTPPKTETFSRPITHDLILKNSKGTWWCKPNSLQKCFDSDFASPHLSLDLQTPSKVMYLRWYQGFWLITRIMMLIVTSALPTH